MTVLMRKHRSECALFKAVEQPHTQDQDPVRDVTSSLARAAAFVHRHLSTWRDPDLVDWPRVDARGHVAHKCPECSRFGLLERPSWIFCDGLDEQRLDHLVNRDQ